MWQSRHECRLFSITTRGSQGPQRRECRFDQGASGLVFDDVPDEADDFDDRRLTLVTQPFSDQRDSGGNHAKRSRFDLIRESSVNVR